MHGLKYRLGQSVFVRTEYAKGRFKYVPARVAKLARGGLDLVFPGGERIWVSLHRICIEPRHQETPTMHRPTDTDASSQGTVAKATADTVRAALAAPASAPPLTLAACVQTGQDPIAVWKELGRQLAERARAEVAGTEMELEQATATTAAARSALEAAEAAQLDVMFRLENARRELSQFGAGEGQ